METPTPTLSETQQPTETSALARLTREKLCDLVWSEAMRTLAPKFGMSLGLDGDGLRSRRQ